MEHAGDESSSAAKGVAPAPKQYERDAMNRPIVMDGCVRGTFADQQLAMDLIYPEDRLPVKDEGELLLGPDDWKKQDMFFEYRIKEGDELKKQGNEKFKAGQYSEAAVFYRKGLYYSVFDESQFNFELQDPHRVEVVKIVVPLRLNYALCLLKDTYEPLKPPLPNVDQKFKEAIENCTEVLNLFKTQQAGLNEADKAKALYRRGLARSLAWRKKVEMGDLDKAKDDMTEALKLDPSNKDVRRELNFLREKEREATEKQKKIWSNTLARGLDDGEDEGQGGLSSEGGAAAERSNASSASRGSGAAAAASERESKAREAKAEIQRYLDELEQQPERPAAGGGWGLGWIKNTVGNFFSRK